MAHQQPPTDLHHEILGVIRQELEPYGPSAAVVDFAWHEGFSGWGVTVTPSNPGAAPLDVGVDIWGGVSIAVANSSMYESIDDSTVDSITTIARYVFAGRVEEIGMRHDAQIRIGDGDRGITFGAATLPIPRRLRRVRRFTAYD